MKKLIEKDPSYYRINLGSGNLIYLSHAKIINNEEYIDLDIRNIIIKIDDLVEGVNALSIAIQNIASITEYNKLTEEIKLLNEKLTKVGDNVAKMMEPKI